MTGTLQSQEWHRSQKVRMRICTQVEQSGPEIFWIFFDDIRPVPPGSGDFPASFLKNPVGPGGRNLRPGHFTRTSKNFEVDEVPLFSSCSEQSIE